MKLKFEIIGGNSTSTQYSLYDFTENYLGETVMSVEVNHETGTWWFVGNPKREMNNNHMVALFNLLSELLNK